MRRSLGDQGRSSGQYLGNEEGKRALLPAIAFGSHIDTVPNGGKYDGALGVLIALEVMRLLQEHRIMTRHPLELVSFSAEEPNPFGISTFGSRAVTKKLKKTDILGVKNPAGQLMTEALRSAGGDPDRFEDAARSPEQLSAFLEVHIEQGKRLIGTEYSRWHRNRDYRHLPGNSRCIR